MVDGSEEGNPPQAVATATRPESEWPDVAAPYVDRKVTGGQWFRYDSGGRHLSTDYSGDYYPAGGKVQVKELIWDPEKKAPERFRVLQEFRHIPYDGKRANPEGHSLERIDYFYDESGRLVCSKMVTQLFKERILDDKGRMLPSTDRIDRMTITTFDPDGSSTEHKVRRGDRIIDKTRHPAPPKT